MTTDNAITSIPLELRCRRLACDGQRDNRQ
jgi:hypothetical protein